VETKIKINGKVVKLVQQPRPHDHTVWLISKKEVIGRCSKSNLFNKIKELVDEI